MLGEINVTPLVDVVLVLLLVFMVTAPMMSRGIDVSLPVADQPQIPQEDRITVSLNAEGRVYVGDQPVNIVLLEDKIRALTGGRPDSVVYLRADEGLRYGQVIRVVDVVKRAGVLRIGFVYALPEEKRPVSDAVSACSSSASALEHGLPATLVLSVSAHVALVGAAVILPMLLPQEPLLRVADGFAVVLPRGGGGTPAAPAPPAQAPEAQAGAGRVRGSPAGAGRAQAAAEGGAASRRPAAAERAQRQAPGDTAARARDGSRRAVRRRPPRATAPAARGTRPRPRASSSARRGRASRPAPTAAATGTWPASSRRSG